MPKAKSTDWVAILRASLKANGLPRGWSVTRSGKHVRLRIRQGSGGADASWTRTLPIEWEIGCIGPVTEFLGGLLDAIERGLSLEQAWQEQARTLEREGNAQVAIPRRFDWRGLAKDFYRDRELNGTQIGPKTMAAEQRFISAALQVLETRQSPQDPYQLISQAIAPWRNAARARKQAVEAMIRWLNYGIAYRGLEAKWTLTQAQKKQLVGRQPARAEKATLTDAQILELIDACPSDEWRTVLVLMATYGLRPEELLHLEVRLDHNSGKRRFWCRYEKASGQHRTKQRWLHAMPLRDQHDRDCFTDLVSAWDAGLLHFPPLKDRGEAISQYLRRLPLWRRWRQECEASNQVLRPYALRDSYSLRAHLRGIPSAQVAHAMGHSDQSHCSHYIWATADTTAAVFERLLQEGNQSPLTWLQDDR